MRTKLSIVCVVLAWLFFFSGAFILCACPGWPAMGVLFAVGALWLRKGKQPLAPMLAMLACTIATGMHLWEKFELPGSYGSKKKAFLQRLEKRAATNSTAPISLPKKSGEAENK
jgi:hypothetical protein